MEPPFVSLILPLRNEGSSIERVLRAVTEQDYPGSRMEILIADGMSTDNTRAIAEDFATRCPQICIRILNNYDLIVPAGMNVALRQAKGEVIVRVDGHTVIAPDYVRQCVDELQRTQADNVGGRMRAVGIHPFGKAVALATSTPFGIGGGRFHYSEEEEWVDTVYMGAWPRRVFKNIGLFDEELVRDQDDEFNYRLRAAGGKILLSPKIKSEYTVRGSPVTLWRQYYQYGYWKIRVLQKHPRQMKIRQFIPPAFVFGLLISGLLAFSPLFRPVSLILPVFYLVTSLLASALTAVQKGWKSLLLPVVFLILHGSYGLGFLVGLVKFSKRWNDRAGKTPAWSEVSLE